MRYLQTCLFLLIFLAMSQTSSSQTNPPQSGQSSQKTQQSDTVRVETELVQIDVVVADKQGKLVNGLKREDFEVFEDGKPQAVSYFSVGTLAQPARWLRSEPKAAGSASGDRTVPVETGNGRHIILAVDDLHLSAGTLLRARQSLLKFIDQQLTGSDQVALITTSGTLGMYQQFTTDREILRRAINRLGVQERQATSPSDIPRISAYQAELIENGDRDALEIAIQEIMRETPGIPRQVADAQARGLARGIVAQNTNVTVNTLGTIENVVRSLAPLASRKMMVLVSDGFLLGGFQQGRHYDVRRITDAATRAGVVIYSIDARGLFTAPLFDASQPGYADIPPGARGRIENQGVEAQRDGMNALAYDTGGFAVFNNNDLNLGLQRVLDDNESYYVMAYEPETAWRDGRFHKIEVRIKDRPELKVRTRKGYLAPDAKAERKAVEKAEKEAEKQKSKTPEQVAKEEKETRLAQVREAVGSLFPLRGIPVEMSADFLDTSETGGVALINARINSATLEFKPVGDRFQSIIEVVLLVYDEKGKVVGDASDQLSLRLRPDRLEAVRQNGIGYNKMFQLKPGFYQVRMAVREEGSKQTGSTSQWIEVADTTQKRLTLSSIFLSANVGDLKQSLTTAQNGAENPDNSSREQQRQQIVQVMRRFKRSESVDFTIFAYNPKAGDKGEIDLVIQSQIFSGSKVIFASPVTKINLPDNLKEQVQKPGAQPIPYAARLNLEGFDPGRYELRLVVIDRVAKFSTKRSISFTIE